MREQLDKKGLPTCETQVTSSVEDEKVWCAPRYNATNSVYVNLGNGNANNNNDYNRNYAVASSDFLFDANADSWFASEEQCYKNKHNSKDAVRVHYHLPEVEALAEQVRNKTYKPGKSICFVLDRPVPREVFASGYIDRIVHHYVAPFIAEVAELVHQSNGDISHGNRIGHSAQTAAEQIRKNIREVSEYGKKPCFVAGFDIAGFFMSIDKNMAFQFLSEKARKYFSGHQVEELLELIKILIENNPAENCERRSPIEKWNKVAPNKSLFNAAQGKGLPIGNFYSQLMANMFLAMLDEQVIKLPVRITRFVDDISIVASSTDDIRMARQVIESTLERMKLTLHPRKVYIQPAAHGISTCGRTIKGGRIYINNRTIRAMKHAIKSQPSTLEGAKNVMKTVNSYFGLLKHCTEWSMQKRYAEMVVESHGYWLYFKERNNQLVCHLKDEFRPKVISINNLKHFHNETRKTRKQQHDLG